MQDTVRDIANGLNKFNSTVTELNSIEVSPRLMTGEGKKCFLTTDATVWVKDGKLVNGIGEPTHRIVSMRGNRVNHIELKLAELNNPNNLITIKL